MGHFRVAQMGLRNINNTYSHPRFIFKTFVSCKCFRAASISERKLK